MLTVCWAAKGGSGTTVVAASLAIAARDRSLLVDLAGDLPTALGIAEPDGPGVVDWLRSDAPAARLGSLELAASEHVSVLPLGRTGDVPADRWDELVAWLRGESRCVIVDAGSHVSPPASLMRGADQTLLVTRSCYLALRAAVRQSWRPSGVVFVEEPGRSIKVRDIEACLGAPVIATLLLDPAVARAVDAGLLVARLPAAFRRALELAA